MKCRYICLSLSCLFLMACSSSRNLDYLSSQNAKNIVVNPPLTKRYVDNTFVIPDVGTIQPASIEPPGYQREIKTQQNAAIDPKRQVRRSER